MSDRTAHLPTTATLLAMSSTCFHLPQLCVFAAVQRVALSADLATARSRGRDQLARRGSHARAHVRRQAAQSARPPATARGEGSGPKRAICPESAAGQLL